MADDFNHPTEILTDTSREAGTEDYDNDWDGTPYRDNLPIPRPIVAVDIKRNQQPKPNPGFNTVALTVTPGDVPVLLLGYDVRRQSFRINTGTVNGVQIGDRSQVQMGLGYVPTAGDTISNAGEFYVATAPGVQGAVTVSVLVEYGI
jgi:hypothetical protein